MSFPGTYMCNVSLCANDPVLRVLAELHIVVIREGMPADKSVKKSRNCTFYVTQTIPTAPAQVSTTEKM